MEFGICILQFALFGGQMCDPGFSTCDTPMELESGIWESRDYFPTSGVPHAQGAELEFGIWTVRALAIGIALQGLEQIWGGKS